MAKSKRYNPYEDAKNILRNKGNYHTAKQMGTDYEQYRQAAAPYYQNLISNGYEDLAQKFADSDYIKAQELFNGLKPDTTVDDYFSSVAANALDNASNPQRSQTAEDLWKAYQNNDSQYNTLFGNEIKYDSNGNVVSGLGVNHYNDGRKMWDSFMNFDVTAQPYYQTIMDAYQLKGGNAARGEQASGAANNAGNIDSYAQANANRQQLAFTTAGIESALAAANQNQKNTLSAYGSVSDYLTNMGNQVNSRGSDLLNAYQNIYSTDSLERQNALNAASDLAQKEMKSKIDKYLADVGYDQAIYTADKNLEGSKYKADANTLAAQIAADADRYTAQQNYAGKVYASDTDKAIAEINTKKKATSEEDEDVPLSEAFSMILQEIGNGGNPAFRSWANVRKYLVDDNGYDAAEVDKMIDNYTGSQYYRGDPFSNYNWQEGVNSLLQKAQAGDAKSAALLRELSPETAAKYGF